MKKYLIVVAIILILSAISAVSIWLLISTAKELKRERSNFYIEAQQTFDKQQEITKREFKVLFQNEMEQLKEQSFLKKSNRRTFKESKDGREVSFLC